MTNLEIKKVLSTVEFIELVDFDFNFTTGDLDLIGNLDGVGLIFHYKRDDAGAWKLSMICQGFGLIRDFTSLLGLWSVVAELEKQFFEKTGFRL